MTIIPLRWLVPLLAVVLYFMPRFVHAEPFAQVSAGGVTIQIHKEPCALKENLPKRATWDQEGKHFEGCAGITPEGLILVYFEDRTVTAIPVQAFARVTGA